MTVPSGALRFNSDSGKLEYYNGEAWWQIDNFSADNATGGARGLFGGGVTVNTIDFITISSTGDAIDFGDLTQARYDLAACSSSTRGVFGGGSPSPGVNTIDFITISSTGDATDFGDLTQARFAPSACSNAHGGL
jgi:hypothetical protein